MKLLSLLLAMTLPAAAWQATVIGVIQGPPPAAQQQQPAQEQQEPKKPGRIEGSVVMMGAETPVRKAQVMIYSSERRMPLVATTNEGGKFVFENVPPGDYNFNATHPRYVSADDSGGFRGPGRRVSLAEGQVVRGIVFKMIPGAIITGRVLDEYGDPQPRAMVNLQRYVFMEGKKQLTPGEEDSTDDRGEYRIFNVAPGRYYLSVQYEDQQWARSAKRSQGEESSYPTIYYPGVLDAETAISLDLRPGQERQGMDFRLVRDRAFRVKGRVMEDGRPSREAMVMMAAKGVMEFRGMKNQRADPSTGEFEFSGVRPGTYILSAMKGMGGREDRLQGQAEVGVGSSNVEGVVVELLPGTNIPGHVVVEGDNAASVSFAEKPTRVYLQGSERGSFGRAMPGAINTDGSFELKSVSAGSYRVRMMPVPDGGYIASAVFGDQDVTGQEFEITPGMQGPLTVRVRMSAATIAGVAKDSKDKPTPNVKILVAPELSKRGQEDLFRLETTDQYGNFTAKNLPPGEYRVWALSKLDYGQHMDPDFLATIEKQGEKVEADEKGSYNIELKLIEVPEGQ